MECREIQTAKTQHLGVVHLHLTALQMEELAALQAVPTVRAAVEVVAMVAALVELDLEMQEAAAVLVVTLAMVETVAVAAAMAHLETAAAAVVAVLPLTAREVVA
jgi:hypothetical protein